MKRLLASFCFSSACSGPRRFAAPATGEYIIVIGGPSLMKWEKYKVAAAHDHWWANFVRAGRIRTEQIRAQSGPDATITWLVYKQGYVDRAQQEKQDLIGHIDSVRDKYNLKLIYFGRATRSSIT